MARPVIVVAFAVGCGPTVGVALSGGDGSAEGDTTRTSAGDDGASASHGDASSGVDAPDSSDPPPAICGDGIVEGDEACDDGNVEGQDGCDALCRVSGTALWQLALPPLSECPHLAALGDGGVAIVGNEHFAPDASIPHVLVVDIDANVRWSFQGGHWKLDKATDIVADADGFIVVGQGAGTPDAFVGWMQRWAADGPTNTEVILGMDEQGDQISDIERRDATSYWIVARDALDPWALLFRGFDEPPTSATTLAAGAFDIQLARAPGDGAYVSVDADAGMLTRVDRDGDVMWTVQYAARGDAVSYGNALASTASGDAIVAGTDQGEPDAQWLRRFDPDGNERWRVLVEVSATPSKDQPILVTVDATDAVFVAGYTQQDGGNTGFVAKYDADGTELWQSTWTAEGGENVLPCDLVVASDGTMVLAGTEFVTGENPDGYWLRAFTP